MINEAVKNRKGARKFQDIPVDVLGLLPNPYSGQSFWGARSGWDGSPARN